MGLRNGDKYYLWEDGNPSSLLGTDEWESNDIDEIYNVACDLVNQMNDIGQHYRIYIEDRYAEKTIDIVDNIPDMGA